MSDIAMLKQSPQRITARLLEHLAPRRGARASMQARRAHLRGLGPGRGLAPGLPYAACCFGLGGTVILSYATLSACERRAPRARSRSAAAQG